MAAGDEVPPEIGSGPNLTEPEGLQQEGIENIEEAQSGISHLDMIDVSHEVTNTRCECRWREFPDLCIPL